MVGLAGLTPWQPGNKTESAFFPPLPHSSFGISFTVVLLSTGPLGEHLLPACPAWLLVLDIPAFSPSSLEAVAAPLPLEEFRRSLAWEMGICCLLG